MGLMDKLAAGVERLAEGADKAIDKGKAKVGELQTEMQMDGLAKKLGYLVFDFYRGRQVDQNLRQKILEDMTRLEDQLLKAKAEAAAKAQAEAAWKAERDAQTAPAGQAAQPAYTADPAQTAGPAQAAAAPGAHGAGAAQPETAPAGAPPGEKPTWAGAAAPDAPGPIPGPAEELWPGGDDRPTEGA